MGNSRQQSGNRGEGKRDPRPRLQLLRNDSGSRAVEEPSKPDLAERPRSSRIKFLKPAQDIRMKILSLVLLSALAPALLVGAASYITARKILNEKVSDQLSAQVMLAAQRAVQYFEDRDADTKVFANAHVVSEHLARWTAARQDADTTAAMVARSRIRQYMAQVKERYPLYRALFIVDSEGIVVSTTEPTELEGTQELPPEVTQSDSLALLHQGDGEPLFYARHPVRLHDDELVGTLVTASGLDELWRSLTSDSESALGELRVIDEEGRVLLDTGADPKSENRVLDTHGARSCLSGESGIAQYRDDRGSMVLGAYRHLAPQRMGFLFEVDSDKAFAASRGLRNFNLLASLLAAGLVTGIAFALVLSLTRPIEALILGAKAVSGGDLSQQIHVFSSDQIGYLTTVFNQMTRSLAESRARLEKISETDELTKLPNRRHLANMFKIELSRAQRTETSLSVLIIDFDHFKQYNDRFGHLQGDTLLREASQFLSENLRPTDVLARFGGEEFVVLLPDTSKKRAVELAERLRADFAEAYAKADEAHPWVTISVGVATHDEDGKTPDALLDSADAALYRAKQQGRNQVQVAV